MESKPKIVLTEAMLKDSVVFAEALLGAPLTEVQRQLIRWERTDEFPVFGDRRSGRTTGAIIKAIVSALRGIPTIIVCPNPTMAKWTIGRARDLLDRLDFGDAPGHIDFYRDSVGFPKGARIHVVSAGPAGTGREVDERRRGLGRSALRIWDNF